MAPIDLRIDHVYLISCKYESDILANASPGRLFDGLLATPGTWDRGDWYEAVAPEELAALYRACLVGDRARRLPDRPRRSAAGSSSADACAMPWPGAPTPTPPHAPAYADLCRAVSTASAARWAERLESSGIARETMLWRLLRIGSAPYFVLGNDRRTGAPGRYRIASPWDWRDQFELAEFTVSRPRPASRGSTGRAPTGPRDDDRDRTVLGHVEIRWSHGRFAQPPEAKVYLDTPMCRLPGYHPLETADEPQLTLWPVAR